jgi:protein-L-isoaspartate(D-aspartate) O-methyltransferase
MHLEIKLRKGPMKFLVYFLVILILSACSLSNNKLVPTATSASITNTDQVNKTINVDDPFLEKRLTMVVEDIEARGISNPDVLRAMRSVPRDKFVLRDYLDLAYSDQPLPIGFGQTISQPYIVAWMTELLDLSDGEKVLEIGTGSGYQAAILEELGDIEVFSIEIVPELAEIAEERLLGLGFDEIHLLQADGYFGWEENQPYDAIIVTAAPDHLPQPLVNQLVEGGKIVIPIGPQGAVQTLWVFEKKGGDLTARNMGLVSFVPFKGGGIETEYPKP